MQTRAEHGNRSAILIVAGVDNELIVGGHMRRGRDCIIVIGLDDLFRSRMRQHAVADQYAEPAGIKECFVLFGNAVDDAGDAERVVRPAPLLAVERQSCRRGAVDVGKFIGLDFAVGPPARANTPSSGVICCSRLRLTPPRL